MFNLFKDKKIPAQVPQTLEPPKPLEVCPYCGKEFKNLKRHINRCSANPNSSLSSSPSELERKIARMQAEIDSLTRLVTKSQGNGDAIIKASAIISRVAAMRMAWNRTTLGRECITWLKQFAPKEAGIVQNELKRKKIVF